MPIFAGVWKANVNGHVLDLTIGRAGADGVVDIQLLGFPTRGFWDEGGQRLTFGVTATPIDSPFVAAFDGCLIRTPPNPAPGQDVALTLTGTFTAYFPSAGDPSHPAVASSRRSVFGWYATAAEVN